MATISITVDSLAEIHVGAMHLKKQLDALLEQILRFLPHVRNRSVTLGAPADDAGPRLVLTLTLADAPCGTSLNAGLQAAERNGKVTPETQPKAVAHPDEAWRERFQCDWIWQASCLSLLTTATR